MTYVCISHRGRQAARVLAWLSAAGLLGCGSLVWAQQHAPQTVPALGQHIEYRNFLGMQFVELPAGHFYMGACKFVAGQKSSAESCPSGAGTDPEAYDDEIPQHRVDVRRFQLARHATTLGQYLRYLQASQPDQALTAEFRQANFGQGEQTPVVWVSWFEAQEFIAWLNRTKPASDRGVYRLPSEAQWEYAARAGTITRYYFGDAPDHQLGWSAWYDKNAGNRQRAVGSKRPNAWGLHDMLGNVWEWTQDCWHEDYRGAPQDGSAWLEAAGGECQRRVVRGGSWYDVSLYLRASQRFGDAATRRINYTGFRVLRELDD